MRVLFLSSILGLLLLAPGNRGAGSLFDDPVVAKCKLFEIRESEVQKAYVEQKAASAAIGQPQPSILEERMKHQILEKMIATRLLLAKATPFDKEAGEKLAARMIQENKEKLGSESTYRRRLLAVGSSPEKYEAEIKEQAIVQSVIDRELKNKVIVNDAEVRKFYEEHADDYVEPAKARVAHILFATRKIPSGEPFSLEERQAKKLAAQKALARVRQGEDFTKLVQELSEDPASKKDDGVVSFSRGTGEVPPSFEAAAFSLDNGQTSDLVTTVFGYHILKLIEKTPPGRVPLEKVQDNIREALQRAEVQKKLPGFVASLKEEAGLELTAAAP